MRKIQFDPNAFQQFLEWETSDKDIFKKIKDLTKEISREPLKGIGKPEPLKGNRKGYWSRRITQEHRLIYKVEEDNILIASCFGHYEG